MSDDRTTVNWCQRSHEQAKRIEGLLEELEAYKAVAEHFRVESLKHTDTLGVRCDCNLCTYMRTALDALRATEVGNG